MDSEGREKPRAWSAQVASYEERHWAPHAGSLSLKPRDTLSSPPAFPSRPAGVLSPKLTFGPPGSQTQLKPSPECRVGSS